jgi:hypothetical protein
MSKFLKLVAKYNNLLNEADQVDPNVATNPQAVQPAEAEQVSPTIPSALPNANANPPMDDELNNGEENQKGQANDVQNFLESLFQFFTNTYKGDSELRLKALDDLKGRADMTNLPTILKNLSDLLNPQTTPDTKQQIENSRKDLNDIKSADDYQ